MSKHPFMDPHCFQKLSTENECGAYWLIRRVHGERMKMQYSSVAPLPRFYASESIHSLCRIYAFHSVDFVTQHSTHLFTRQRGHIDGITYSQRETPDRSYLSHHNMAFKVKEDKWIIDACFFFSLLTIHIISFLSQLPISTILALRMGTGS